MCELTLGLTTINMFPMPLYFPRSFKLENTAIIGKLIEVYTHIHVLNNVIINFLTYVLLYVEDQTITLLLIPSSENILAFKHC